MIASSLMGCVGRTADTSWVKPIYFHEQSLQWLDAHKPWPPELRDDLGQIYLHNKKCEELRK